MSKVTNTQYLIFASDTEAQLKFDDSKYMKKYSLLNKKKRELITENELIRLGVRQGNIKNNLFEIKKLEKQLNHLQPFLCEEMNTYLIGYAPVYRTPYYRRRRDAPLKRKHKYQKHTGDFKNCQICHKLEKTQVTYFEAKDIKDNAWFKMLDDMVFKYKQKIIDGGISTALIYFHNLNYDIQSLLQTIVDNRYLFDDIKVMNSSNAWYSLKFKYKDCCFELRDSWKLYTQPLAKLATLVGWDKLTDQATYEWFDLNSSKFDDELEYFIYDINILVHVLEMHFDKFSKQKIMLTMPGYAEKELKKCIKEDDRKSKGNNYYKIFNVKLKDNVENFIRSAYFGGFVYANNQLINKKLTKGITADVNSLYPSVMLNRDYPDIHSMRELKEDEFKTLKKNDYHNFVIANLEITKLKLKPKHVPCFPKKAGFGVPKDILTLDDLLNPFEETADVSLTLLDLYHIEKNYEIEYRYNYGLKADKYIKRPFTSFVLKHKKEKEDAVCEGNSVKKLIAKLMLNSCYGKFAQRNIEEEKELTVNEEGLPALVTCQKPHDEDKKRHNILIGCFVTAFARDVLLSAIENINKSELATFWYCDTDSVHFGYNGNKDYIKEASQILNDVGIPFDSAEFGKWKDEQYMQYAKYLGSKRYWEYDPVLKVKGKDPNVIKGAGIQKVGKEYLEKKGIDYFTYSNGNTIWVPFKVSKKVYGGIKIFMDFKEIKPSHWQYNFI